MKRMFLVATLFGAVISWSSPGGAAVAADAATPTTLPAALRGADTIAATDVSGRVLVVTGTDDAGAHADRWDRLTGSVTSLPADLRAVSDDGSAIITAAGSWMDVDSHLSVPVPDGSDLAAIHLSADGRTYVVGGTDGTGSVVTGATQERTALPASGTPVAISPNGRFVLVSGSCRSTSDVVTDCTRRWDRQTGAVDVVARQSAGESMGSGVADTGRVIVESGAAAGGPIYVAKDLGGARHTVAQVPLSAGGELSDDGEVYLLHVSPSLCCPQVTVLDVATGTRLGSVQLAGPAAPLGGATSAMLTGDGAQIAYLFREPSSASGPAYMTLRFQPLTGRQATPRLAGGEVFAVTVTGRAGVGTDATAVMLNVTITDPVAAGYVTVWPCGQPRPLASNVNFVAGATVAVGALSGVGSGGSVCVLSNVAADVVVDVQGWFGPDSPYHAITPDRVADSRHGETDTVANLAAGTPLAVHVADAGVPPDAAAAMLSVTVANPALPGFLTVWPCGTPQPLASNVNFVEGQVVANAVLAGLGSGGDVCVASNVDVDVVVDVQGWFPAGSDYTGAVPDRVLDTRLGETDAVPNVTAGKIVPVRLSPTAGAGVLDVTVTNPSAAGYVTVWPCLEDRPLASNVNFTAGQTVANLVFASAGPAQTVCLVSNVDLDFVVDLQGTFATPSPFHPLTPSRLVDTRD